MVFKELFKMLGKNIFEAGRKPNFVLIKGKRRHCTWPEISEISGQAVMEAGGSLT